MPYRFKGKRLLPHSAIRDSNVLKDNLSSTSLDTITPSSATPGILAKHRFNSIPYLYPPSYVLAGVSANTVPSGTKAFGLSLLNPDCDSYLNPKY